MVLFMFRVAYCLVLLIGAGEILLQNLVKLEKHKTFTLH